MMASAMIRSILFLVIGRVVTGTPDRLLGQCEREMVVGAKIMTKPALFDESGSVSIKLTTRNGGNVYSPGELLSVEVIGLSPTAKHLLVVSGATFSPLDTSCENTRTLLKTTSIQMPTSGNVIVSVGWNDISPYEPSFLGVKIVTTTLSPLLGM